MIKKYTVLALPAVVKKCTVLALPTVVKKYTVLALPTAVKKCTVLALPAVVKKYTVLALPAVVQKVYGADTANSGQKACGTYWQWINQNFIIWRSGFQLSCFLLLGTISILTEISQQQGAIYGKG